MWLQARMYLLIALLFAILYGVITGLGTWMGAGSAITYLVIGFGFLLIQYLISPALVGWSMKIKWVTEKEAPELHQMVTELAGAANLPKPKVGISQLNIPNAFAFGRTQRDGRVCVTQGIMKLLNKDELRAVIGHELSHINLDEDLAETFGLEEAAGALVAGVIEGDPADRAGIKRGDIILEFDGQKVEDNRALVRIVGATPVSKATRDG